MVAIVLPVPLIPLMELIQAQMSQRAAIVIMRENYLMQAKLAPSTTTGWLITL